MCGTERSGHQATDPALFTGARWAVCLEEDTELARWLRVAEGALAAGAGGAVCLVEDPDLARGLRVAEVALAAGAEVVPVTAAEHDDAVAAISHVPHLLSARLGAAGAHVGA